MSRPKGLAALLIFSIFPFASVLAQQPRVTVQKPGDKELKRTAHRLHITVDRLKNARAMLEEATEAASRPEFFSQGGELSRLGHLWIRVDLSRAAAVLEPLFHRFKTAAALARDAGDYQRNCRAAGEILPALSQLDFRRAIQLVEQWPAPSTQLGEAAQQAYAQMTSQFHQAQLHRAVTEDPQRALELLAQRPAEFNYSVRGQLATQLFQKGRKEEALRIVDQAIARFRDGNLDTRAYHDFNNFVGQLGHAFPDRFQDAFPLLLSYIKANPQITNGSVRLHVGDRVVELDSAEHQLLNLLRNHMVWRPESMLRALDSVPELRARLDQLGGIDGFFNANTVYQTKGHSFGERHGIRDTSPGSLRKQLSELGSTPESVGPLLAIAGMSMHQDPELCEQALARASVAIFQIEPLDQRARPFMNLLNLNRQFEGEVDHGLMKQGFTLLNQLREQDGFTPLADHLEQALLSEWARMDAHGALACVRAVSDPAFRLRALLRISEALVTW